MRRNVNFLGHFLKDAGIIARSAFQRVHAPPKRKIEYVRIIHKGNYYRRPIPTTKNKSTEPPELMKLPPAGQTVLPLPFKSTSPVSSSTTESPSPSVIPISRTNGNKQSQSWSWRSWWKLNGPLVVLNFGSVASLIGFTRTDILELRALSVTGSLTFIVYTLAQHPIRWPSVFWSSLFTSVNGFKIAGILQERKGEVNLSPREEEIYQEHFQPHGVTPKQFERILSRGTTRTINKGNVLSRQGVQSSSVLLVVRGNTRASIKGRHLTAIGSKPGNKDKFAGGDSGAWVGEMSFLQYLWDKDQSSAKVNMKKNFKSEEEIENNDSTRSEDITVSSKTANDRKIDPNKYCAMSTIVAVDDIELIEWSFEDMEQVMKTSLDMQRALTRCMTAAILGKVVNFMMSKQVGMPSVSTMLDNWKYRSVFEDDEEEERVLAETLK